MNEELKSNAMDMITFDEFLKVDIRTGTIISAERIEKSKKLLKLQVDFGDLGMRTILAGIGDKFNPENIVNYQALFVVNLPSKEIAGHMSEGMILAMPTITKDLWLPGRWYDNVKNGTRLT